MIPSTYDVHMILCGCEDEPLNDTEKNDLPTSRLFSNISD